MRRRIRLCAVVGIVLVGLAGCSPAKVSGKGHVVDGAQVPYSKPSEPADIHQSTDQGAKAAAQHWLKVFDYSFYSGDTKPLNDISLPGCESCEKTIDNIRKNYDEGSRFVGDPVIIKSEKLALFESENTAIVTINTSGGRVFRVTSDGNRSVYLESKEESTNFKLLWKDQEWKMAEFSESDG